VTNNDVQNVEMTLGVEILEVRGEAHNSIVALTTMLDLKIYKQYCSVMSEMHSHTRKWHGNAS
jgi:hypothetical protein